jgi:hypothetical protein
MASCNLGLESETLRREMSLTLNKCRHSPAVMHDTLIHPASHQLDYVMGSRISSHRIGNN